MPRGRPPSTVEKGRIDVTLRQSTIDRLNMLTLDPFTDKQIPGRRNAIIEQLLLEYLDSVAPERGVGK